MTVTYEWRGAFGNVELNELHAEAFEARLFDETEWNWVDQVHGHSLGWALVAMAVDQARQAGCEWLHVDFEGHLRPFTSTPAGSDWPTPAHRLVVNADAEGVLPAPETISSSPEPFTSRAVSQPRRSRTSGRPVQPSGYSSSR